MFHCNEERSRDVLFYIFVLLISFKNLKWGGAKHLKIGLKS